MHSDANENKDNNGPEIFSFFKLPRELQFVVLGFLRLQDIAAMACVSKQMKQLTEDERFWQRKCQAAGFGKQQTVLSWRENFKINLRCRVRFINAKTSCFVGLGPSVNFLDNNIRVEKISSSRDRYNGIWGDLEILPNTGVYEWFVKVAFISRHTYIFVGIMTAPEDASKLTQENYTCLGFSIDGFGYARGYKWVSNSKKYLDLHN